MSRHCHHLLQPGRVAAAVAIALISACDDSPSEPRPPVTEEVGVVVNSLDISLTVFAVDGSGAPFTIGLGADGSPVTLAVRDGTAVVPMGSVPAAVVVDIAAGTIRRTVPLPEGSGATGAAFINDSIAVVANSGLNSVSAINVRTGAVSAPVAVGRFPQAVVAINDTAYVLNAELGPDFEPAGFGTVSVLTGSPLAVVGTIVLSGTNPGGASISPNGRIHVINAGRFGRSEGSLSVIDRGSLAEIAHHEGFGSFPGSIAVGADGRVYVGGFGIGLLVWNDAANVFVRGPANPVAPDGIRSVSGVGVDAQNRAYALKPECQGPGEVLRLSSGFDVDGRIPAGICPLAIAFTRVTAGGA